jgi:hypothetical protein
MGGVDRQVQVQVQSLVLVEEGTVAGAKGCKRKREALEGTREAN